jgi:hypothetical protein
MRGLSLLLTERRARTGVLWIRSGGFGTRQSFLSRITGDTNWAAQPLARFELPVLILIDRILEQLAS